MRAAAILCVLLAPLGWAQSAPPRDERVLLDSAEKRIVEENYHDDKAVTLRGDQGGGWQLSAGAAIDARRIDLTLRNVRGEVRFRADVSRLQTLLRLQRETLAGRLR